MKETFNLDPGEECFAYLHGAWVKVKFLGWVMNKDECVAVSESVYSHGENLFVLHYSRINKLTPDGWD